MGQESPESTRVAADISSGAAETWCPQGGLGTRPPKDSSALAYYGQDILTT
jgi:hypothetical protein